MGCNIIYTSYTPVSPERFAMHAICLRVTGAKTVGCQNPVLAVHILKPQNCFCYMATMCTAAYSYNKCKHLYMRMQVTPAVEKSPAATCELVQTVPHLALSHDLSCASHRLSTLNGRITYQV